MEKDTLICRTNYTPGDGLQRARNLMNSTGSTRLVGRIT